MGKPTTTEIVSWAEAHTADRLPAPNTGAPHLDPIEIVDILRWDAQGLTQQAIAAKFNPPKHQSTISRCLRDYGTDTTTEAKRIFAAQAGPTALRILKDGRPRDLIAVHQGIGTLQPERGDMKIAIGISLPGLGFASQTSADSAVIHSPSGDLGSDNQRYVATTEATPSGEAGR